MLGCADLGLRASQATVGLASRAEVAKGEPVRNVSLVFVLIVLRLAASAGHLVHVERVDALSEHTLASWVRLTRLADVSLLRHARFVCLLAALRCLHVGTVAQLPLLVLEVRIVGRIGSAGKVIVVAYDVVVGRGGGREAKVGGLARHAAGDSEALRAHLGRVEARAHAKLGRPVVLLVLHPLVDLLFRVDAELIADLAIGHVAARHRVLPGSRLSRSLGCALFEHLGVAHGH